MNKLERRFGKYAVKNLSLVLVIVYGAGYLLSMMPFSTEVIYYLSLNPYFILHGQVWRIITWVLIPPGAFSLLTFITLFFFWSIGTTLENTWGTFRYNVYIFSGIIFTVIGSFIALLFTYIYGNIAGFDGMATSCLQFLQTPVSTYYISMSIFLAFAATYPNARVLLFFIIPIRIKWLGIIDGALLLLDFIFSNGMTRIMIFTSLLNFIIFYFAFRGSFTATPRVRAKQAARRRTYEKDVKSVDPMMPKHRCAICGKTDIDFPDAEFRFCSKCNGNYEYCNDHLYSHKHVE